MLVETSALVAIVADEREAGVFLARIVGASNPLLPASCYLEAAMVLAKRKNGKSKLDQLVAGFAITFIPLDEPVARLAADAFARYGRGTGHPAALNFGDCIAYATAMHLDVPLLFKGDDFRHTDVKAAL
ncbi:MAG: type II toxin-antitoxin system VapC family toxin [Phreatobacter sp.]|nr:type II toxin-antitoxin system VapC family toxin [Phreatobacter sp.]